MELPTSFIEQTRALLGDNEYEKLAAALQQDSPVSIRLNPPKWEEKAESPFRLSFSALRKVPWASNGYYLDARPAFTFDPLFHAGCYYVQEASSMFVEQVLRQYVTRPVVMLDLCAAPGGKSTLARNVLPEGSLLVANEVVRSRSQVLAENLTKWGHPDTVVTNNDPADFRALPDFFDVVLTDVPCSGEGMFRKDPASISEWSLENVENCRQRQQRILTDVWHSLKPGGLLIYSTCTYNSKENEDNVEWMQRQWDAELLPVQTLPEWNISGSTGKASPVYHFFPHRTKGEGFFLAVLRKQEEEEYLPARKASGKKEKRGKGKLPVPLISKSHLSTAQSWLSSASAENYQLQTEGNAIFAFPRLYADALSLLRQHLRILQAGVPLGEVKGKDLLPAHALAMCPFLLRRGAFVEEELTPEQAIAYLRKEAVVLPPTAPLGYLLLTYRGIPLGFAKNVGNRANNLYPQEWRIRSGYVPEEAKGV